VRLVCLALLLAACEKVESSTPPPEPVPPPSPAPDPQRDRGFIGVRYVMDSYTGGARIESLLPGSPAEAAGLKVDDIILRYDDEPIAAAQDLASVVGKSSIGHVANIQVDRAGHRLTFPTRVQVWPLTVRDEQDLRSPP
jgi:S1-C subfamily serine protease